MQVSKLETIIQGQGHGLFLIQDLAWKSCLIHICWMSKWINRISEPVISLMRTWGSREVTWLIRIMQLFSGWYWDWLSASCFLPQTAAPNCPEERLTLGWNRLSRVSLLLCHVRVSGVALIHSAAPGPEMSLVKATQTSMLLHPVDTSLSSCYLTFQHSWLFPPSWNAFSFRLLWEHNGLFLSWSLPLISFAEFSFLADH